MAETEDVNAAFDSLLVAEDRTVSKGFEEGYKAGKQEGKQEGERLGKERGQQVGQEIGFYLGFSEEWLEVYQNKPSDKKAAKILSSLQKLHELADSFPSENSKEEDFTERLQQARAKFKLLCSLLRLGAEGWTAATSW